MIKTKIIFPELLYYLH